MTILRAKPSMVLSPIAALWLILMGLPTYANEDDLVTPSIADYDGVAFTLLAQGDVFVNFDDETGPDATSILAFGRYQLAPGESRPVLGISPGNEDSPGSGIGYVEFGTTTVIDSQNQKSDFDAPATILHANEIRNESFNCTWILSAEHYLLQGWGGGSSTDATSLVLPTTVPCDEPYTTLGHMPIPGKTPKGMMRVFIGEIALEPGLRIATLRENGFVGFVVERGDISIQPQVDSMGYGPDSSRYILEESDYTIETHLVEGATGLVYGFLRVQSDSVSHHHQIAVEQRTGIWRASTIQTRRLRR